MRRLITLLFVVLTTTTVVWAATTPITLGTTESLATGIGRAGSVTDVTITVPVGYTGSTYGTTNDLTSIASTITDLTIQGATSASVLNLRQINLPARTLNSVTIKGLSISGVNESTATKPYNLLYYIFSNAGGVTNLTFQNCKIANFRGVVRLNSGSYTYSNIKFDGCDIRSIADFNLLNVGATCVVNTVTLINSSVYAQTGRLFYMVSTATNPTSVTIDHCTIDNYGLGNAYLVEYASTNSTTSTSVTNCLFARTPTTSGIRYGATPTFTNNYKSTDWPASNGLTATTVNSNSSTTSLFNTPVTYNFIPGSTITCSTTSGSTIVTVGTASSNIFVGQSVTLSGTIPANATVATVTGSPVTSFTLSAAATLSNGSAAIVFGQGISSSLADYTIKDAAFTGKASVGNPNCYYPVSVTPSVSSLSGFNYNVGGSCTAQNFTLNALALRKRVGITAPTDYEISTDGGTTYVASDSLGTVGGDITNKVIYVRLKSGLSVGAYNSEQISIATSGYTTKTVACSGSVTQNLPTLSTPTGLSTSNVTYNSFRATWSAVSNSVNYSVVVYQGGNTVSTTNGVTNTYLDVTGLSASTDYTFAVTANGDGTNYNNSTQSSTCAVTTLVTPTYTITVNKAGAGATWGTITQSPAPINGKYAINTSVTLTPSYPSLIVSSMKWDDNSTGAKTITVTGDATYTATFNTTPYYAVLTGWNISDATTRSNRPGDYYFNSNNMGVLRLYTEANANTSWTQSTIATKTCARRWTTTTNMPAQSRYFQVEVSTKGYKTIQVASQIAYDNNSVHQGQKLQYSIDGTSFTDLASYNLSGATKSTWYNLNASLPALADNISTLYLRWIGDVTTALVGTISSETSEGFYLTNVVISGTPISSDAVSGDYVATTSGDINTAANYSVSGGSFGISGTAASAPTAGTNVIIPAGITMTNAASATCNQLKIRGTYSAQADMNATGGIVVQSDSTGTGAILDNGNTITGTATVQQYVSGTSGTVPRGWWYVSSPVSNGTASVFGLDASHRLWSWDEPSVAYQEITSGGTVLNAGQGYAYSNTGGDATLSFTGTLNTGDITLNLTRTGTTAGYRGYNLIGNPYPSYLDWNAATKTNIRSTIWYRTWTKGGQMAFDTYDGSTGTANGMRGAVSQYIPPMQGFWVKVDADPVDPATVSNASITFHNADRLYKDQILQTNRLRTKAENSTDPGLVRLRVSNGINSDEAILVADPNASDAADKSDSPKMSNKNPEIPEIYTQAGNEDLVINHLNNFSAGKTLTLGFRPGKASDFSIVANEISNVGSDLKVVLVDNLTSATYDLTDGSAYTFSADATASTSRFSVQFRAKGVVSNTSNEAADKVIIYENAQHQIAVNLNQLPVGGKLSVYNSVGQQLLDKKISEKQISVAQHLAPGVYTVELTVNNQRIVKKIVMQ